VSAGDIAALIDEAHRQIAGCSGPGVAEVTEGLDRIPAKVGTLPEPQELPACAFLDGALEAVAASGRTALADAIARAHPSLRWIAYDLYPIAEIGSRMAGNHAFAELIGPVDAPVHAKDFALGLFLIGPRTLYRDHRHNAPELYLPFTGPTWWRFEQGPWEVRRPGEPVWNPSLQVHATLVRDEPLLCLYAWTRDVRVPASVVAAADWAEIEGGL
jgi:hypothetical protein